MKIKTRTLRFGLTALIVTLFATTAAHSQVDHEVVNEGYDESSSGASAYTLQSTEELENLVGPIALYPDDLVSIILPAATYPVQVVQAARFLEDREGNPNLQPPDDWDDAVVALLNYPEVIEMMNDDLDWTWALGEAFLSQQSDVLAAVAEFRDEAYAAGNLKSDEHQVVSRVERVIEIVPADPEVIYVPYYEPERVVIYQPYPVYHYHPYPRYSYYYPYPANYGFSYGYFFGVSTAYRLHWANYGLFTYNYGYYGHPYYNRGYHHRFYYRHRPFRSHRPRLARSHDGYVNRGHDGDRWKPRRRHGPRPQARAQGRLRASAHDRNRDFGRDQRTQLNQGGHGATSASSNLATRDRGRGQQRQSQLAFSDKDPDQRRLVRRYRDEAKTGSVDSNRRSADGARSRIAKPVSDRSAGAKESSARHNIRIVRPDGQTRSSQRSRLTASENRRDIAARTSNSQRRNISTQRIRQAKPQARNTTINVRRPGTQQRSPKAGQVSQIRRDGNVQRETRQATSTRSAPQRRPAERQAIKAPPQARQVRTAPTSSRARPARAEEKRAPARAKQRASGGRSERRRR